jgi:hypothetical protein
MSINYKTDGGLLVLIGAATVEQTGLVSGEIYEFVASWPCLCRWGADDASIADGGFDFAVPAGGMVVSQCPEGVTAINVIELSAESNAAAALAISQRTTR